MAARGNKALATFIPEGFGAGVGRVAPYYEQGNWFRGGAVQMLFMMWLRDAGFQTGVRPMFPAGSSQEQLVIAAKSYDLHPHEPPVDWSKAVWYLPEKDILKSVGAGSGIFADVTPGVTHGNMIARTPNDPAWYKGGLWNDSMTINIPGLWMMSWYDVSVGPNLAAYNFVRKTAKPEIANEQYAVIAPVSHCAYKRATEDTIVGERSMGDARLDYDALTYGWFDYFLKGEQNGILEKTPKVRYFTMGSNKWQTSDTWPPAGAKPVTYYFASAGNANTMYGDGALTIATSDKDQPDKFVYDPDESGDHQRRRILLHGHGLQAGCGGPAADGDAQRHPRLQQRAVERRYGSDRADRRYVVCLERRQGHRLHGQGDRRAAGRHGLQHRRQHPAGALSRRLRQAAGVDGKRKGVQGNAAADADQQLLCARSQATGGSQQQQLPALRSQSEYRRQ